MSLTNNDSKEVEDGLATPPLESLLKPLTKVQGVSSLDSVGESDVSVHADSEADPEAWL